MPQLFLGWLLGTRRSAIGHFFSVSLVTVPDVFAKVNLAQIASFLKWRVIEKCLLPFILTCIAEYLRRYFFFQIVIATPGRLIDVLGKCFLYISHFCLCSVGTLQYHEMIRKLQSLVF